MQQLVQVRVIAGSSDGMVGNTTIKFVPEIEAGFEFCFQHDEI
jgi:hypothetical protein